MRATGSFIDPTMNGIFDRTTRSKTKPKVATQRLKLKLGEKNVQNFGNSFLGAYDRELDSDDEDLVFEEQFILKMSDLWGTDGTQGSNGVYPGANGDFTGECLCLCS